MELNLVGVWKKNIIGGKMQNKTIEILMSKLLMQIFVFCLAIIIYGVGFMSILLGWAVIIDIHNLLPLYRQILLGSVFLITGGGCLALMEEPITYYFGKSAKF